MLRAGDSRHRMARALNAAYGEGLLSEKTLAYRLDLLFRSALVEPRSVIGDLAVRRAPRRGLLDALGSTVRSVCRLAGLIDRPPAPAPTLLALDWTGAADELLLGRHHGCDVTLSHISVSRRHARLSFRDGNWILRDLESTNGTTVNGTRVVRCRLLPGDRLMLGDEPLLVD
jgi:hypothetical protein